MIKEILQIGNSLLLEESEPIDLGHISSEEVQEMATNLLETVKFYKKSAAGLAGVQIGYLKRMFVIKRMDIEDAEGKEIFEVLINPIVKEKSKKLSTEWEGCMSINKDGFRLFGPVSRVREVEISYYSLEGEKKLLRSKGFFSHLIQHELDHLNGKLFISYIDNPKNIWNEKELDLYISKNKSLPSPV